MIPYITATAPAGIVTEKNGTTRMTDVYSKLLESNIIVVDGEIADQMADTIVSEMIYLATSDAKKPIQLLINSPGGSVTAGLGIVDAMNYIPNPVYTFGFGMCASMGAVILTSGEKGHRFAFPNCEIMIHQPSGGTGGMQKESDIDIIALHLKDTKKKLNEILLRNLYGAADEDGKPYTYNDVARMTDRDNYLSAEDALRIGFIDKVAGHME